MNLQMGRLFLRNIWLTFKHDADLWLLNDPVPVVRAHLFAKCQRCFVLFGHIQFDEPPSTNAVDPCDRLVEGQPPREKESS